MIFELQRVDLLREVRGIGRGFRLARAADEGGDGLARDHEERVGQADAAPLLHVEDAREVRLERERQIPVAGRVARAELIATFSLLCAKLRNFAVRVGLDHLGTRCLVDDGIRHAGNFPPLDEQVNADADGGCKHIRVVAAGEVSIEIPRADREPRDLDEVGCFCADGKASGDGAWRRGRLHSRYALLDARVDLRRRCDFSVAEVTVDLAESHVDHSALHFPMSDTNEDAEERRCVRIPCRARHLGSSYVPLGKSISDFQDFAQIPLDGLGDVWLVHRVDVDVLHVVCDEVDDLLGRIDDACLLHRLWMLAELVDDLLEAGRHGGAGEGDGAAELLLVRDRHDAGENRHTDILLAETIEEVEELRVVEEHLRGQEVDTCVDLALQIPDVVVLVRALDMSVRIAGTADAEVALGLDVRDELTRIVVVVIWCTALRDVTAQRHDVLEAVFLKLLNHLVHVRLRGGYTGEMRQHLDPVLVPDVLRDVQRKLGGSAARTIGYGHEARVERRYALRRRLHGIILLDLLRWEHLEGKRDLILV